MKSLTRTIIVLVVLNLAMGKLVLAQAEDRAEPTARRQAPVPMLPEPTEPTQPWTAPPMPTTPEPGPEAPDPTASPAPSPYPTQPKSTGHISSRKVLVIPDSDLKPEDLDALIQDLLVMSHILDERFKGSRMIKGVFTDFGDFFGRDNRSTQAIYIQGFGALFLMEVNFAFSPPLISEEQKDEEAAEQVDPTWQRARQQIFSPKAPLPGFSEQNPGLVKFDQLKKELIETLKHAANIRNLTPDEWVIVTVIGQGRQPGEFYPYSYRDNYEDYEYEDDAARSEASTSRRGSRRPSRREGGGMMGGMGGYGGGMMGGMGGYGGGMGGFSGSMYGGMGGYGGGMYGGMGGYGGGMGGFGGMAGYGEMGLPSAAVLTIRAKKADVDDFAKDELDVEEFQDTVEIFTY